MSDKITVTSGLLAAAQAAIVTRLRKFAWFATVNIVSERIASIPNKIEQLLGTMSTTYDTGVVLVIMMPWADDPKTNIPAPFFDPFYVDLVAHENVTINTSGKTADDVVINAYRILKGWHASPFDSALASPGEGALGSLSVPEAPHLYMKRCRLKTKLLLPPLRLPGETDFVTEA
jgi:hypothetical protein